MPLSANPAHVDQSEQREELCRSGSIAPPRGRGTTGHIQFLHVALPEAGIQASVLRPPHEMGFVITAREKDRQDRQM